MIIWRESSLNPILTGKMNSITSSFDRLLPFPSEPGYIIPVPPPASKFPPNLSTVHDDRPLPQGEKRGSKARRPSVPVVPLYHIHHLNPLISLSSPRTTLPLLLVRNFLNPQNLVSPVPLLLLNYQKCQSQISSPLCLLPLCIRFCTPFWSN